MAGWLSAEFIEDFTPQTSWTIEVQYHLTSDAAQTYPRDSVRFRRRDSREQNDEFGLRLTHGRCQHGLADDVFDGPQAHQKLSKSMDAAGKLARHQRLHSPTRCFYKLEHERRVCP